MKLCFSSKWVQLGLIACASFAAAPQVFAQDAGTRVAVVNSEKVFNESIGDFTVSHFGGIFVYIFA